MACRRCITRSSMRRTSAMARRRTSFSCASKPMIQSLKWLALAPSSKVFPRSQWWRWSINGMKHTTTVRVAGRSLALSLLGGLTLIVGCRQDMQDQPTFVPQRGTTLFADGRSARPQVEHSVARGQLREDQYFYTGLVNGKEQDQLPFP